MSTEQIRLRKTQVLTRATEVLGDVASARAWMDRNIRSIGGLPPSKLIRTSEGFELVMSTLGRIEQGIVA